MAIATLTPASCPTLEPPRIVDGTYRLSLEQYDRMVEVGILTKYDRTFLLHGLLVTKMTQDPAHSYTILAVVDALSGILRDGWHIRPQCPIGLANDPKGCASAPEPDVAVVPGTRHDYRKRHPAGQDVALVIEVFNTSLPKDRKLLPCYAFAGIPVAWIANLDERSVEVDSDPSGPGAGEAASYGSRRTYRDGEAVEVLLGGVEVGRIPVAAILPESEPRDAGREGGG